MKEEGKTYDVYEVHGGSTARAAGWDFTVCRTLELLKETIEADADELKPGDELKIIFRHYTQEQMDDVVFEV